MLKGAARKVAVPFVLLSVVGWIVFGVGFGIRNFEYKDRTDVDDDAAKPEFFSQWVFGVSAPFLFIMTVIHLFCDGRRFTAFFVFFLLPFFLVGCGGVLLFNGLQIYQYYKDKDNEQPDVFIVDTAQVPDLKPDIHKDDKYIVVEFSGAIASGLFYWVYLLLLAFFETRHWT